MCGSAAKYAARSGLDNFAGFQHVSLICYLQCLPGVLFYQEDCDVLALKFFQYTKYFANKYRRQPQAWFIQHQQLGLGHQCSRNSQHLLLPTA